MMGGFAIEIGERHGRLVLGAHADGLSSRYRFATCDCGNEKVVDAMMARQGRVLSCGCLRRLKLSPPPTRAAKACEVCGRMWVPATKDQAARNSTCGIECRGVLIARRRGRSDEAVRAFIASNILAQENGCHFWLSDKDAAGYGRICVRGKKKMAHRVAYEFAVGAIPAGFQLDHLCRNPSCVNPEHLEPVTQRENLRRQWADRRAEAGQ